MTKSAVTSTACRPSKSKCADVFLPCSSPPRLYMYTCLNISFMPLICSNRLGLLDDVPIDKKDSPLDTLSYYLSQRLSFGKCTRSCYLLQHFSFGKYSLIVLHIFDYMYVRMLLYFSESHERDVLIMRHDVTAEYHDRNVENHHIDFVVYGDPGGYSAMAKTVGYPTAIATKMILEGA